MKIYVDKLPKSCEECPCCNECMDYGISCNLDDIKLSYYDYANKRHINCALQSITNHDNQVKKKVCEKIYNKCEPLFRLVNNYDNGDVIERNELVDILEQIEGAKQ